MRSLVHACDTGPVSAYNKTFRITDVEIALPVLLPFHPSLLFCFPTSQPQLAPFPIPVYLCLMIQ